MKKVIIILISLVMIICIGVFINNYMNTKILNDKKKAEIEDNRVEYIDEEEKWSYRFYVLQEMVKKDIDWDKIIIPEELKKEYKVKYPNGLFKDDDYDTIELQNDIEEEYIYNNPVQIFIATTEKKQDRFIVYCDENVRYCKINRIVKEELFDDDGNKIWKGYPMDKEHWITNLTYLCIKDDKEIGRSKRFDSEHPNFTGLLNPYDEEFTSEISIATLKEQCNFDAKEYMCEVNYRNRYLYVTYKLKYTVDDFNYLDTVKIEELSSREYELNDYGKLVTSTGIAVKILLKNRDLSGLPMSNKLIDKIKNNLIGYDIIKFRGIKYNDGQKNNKNLFRLVLDNKDVKHVGLKYIIIDKFKINIIK